MCDANECVALVTFLCLVVNCIVTSRNWEIGVISSLLVVLFFRLETITT